MAWYNEAGEREDVVLSTRVRFARNLADYPFTGRLSATAATEIIGKVRDTLEGYREISFSALSPTEAKAYVERHYVSPAFTDRQLPRALFLGEGERVQIMVCEEDHLRIQSTVAGFAPDKAFEAACGADDTICSRLRIAFNERLGYLTHCPTNLGNAMRVSAMMFLPGLTLTGNLEKLTPSLNKVGMTIRGVYGEGSEAAGNIYQISNSSSLGISETDILKNFSDVVGRVSELEGKARALLLEREGDRMTDRVYRSLGILRHAYMLSSEEMNTRLSDIRLGKALGILETVPLCKLTELSIAARPATLSLSGEGLDGEVARDKARARLLRAALAERTEAAADGGETDKK